MEFQIPTREWVTLRGSGCPRTCSDMYSSRHTESDSAGQNHYVVDADWDVLDGVQMGATWRIRLNRPCAAAMGSYVRLVSPVYIFLQYYHLCYYAL